MLFSGYLGDIEKGLAILKNLTDAIGDHVEIIKLGEEDSYVLKVEKGETSRISYKEVHHCYRALGLYIQFVREGQETFEYSEKAWIEKSGGMIDCSRNAVYTVEKVKDILKKSALMGFSTCMLYTEDTYELPDNPYFGYMRGKYSQAELKALDDYAYDLGIELIPCIQTLGHLEQTLRWDYANDIRDTRSTLLIGEEKSYVFIRQMLQSVKETFRTKRVHIGMDEAFGIGTGAYLAKNQYQYQSSFELMKRHLEAVAKVAAELELEPMIWDDMFFANLSEDQSFEEIGKGIPKGMSLVYWDYYGRLQENYEINLNRREQVGAPTIFAGGIWKWTGYVPNYDKTMITATPGLRACKKKGIQEVIVTMWGDDGAEAPIDCIWPDFVLYAEHTYHEEVEDEWVDRRCAFLTGLTREEFKTIQNLDLIPGVESPNNESRNSHKYLMYQDPMMGIFDYYIFDESLPQHYEALSATYETLGDKSPAYKPMFTMYSALAKALQHKALLGKHILAAYEVKDQEQLHEIAQEEIPQAKQAIEAFRQALRAQWHVDCKPYGYDVLDIRLGGVLARLDTAKYRLESYLNNEVSRLEELEEKRLPVTGGNVETNDYPHYNHHARIASQNVVSYAI